MEKIYKCYGRRFKVVPVRDIKGKLCPGCAFDGRERFCMLKPANLTKDEKAMADMCSIYDNENYTTAWLDITPWYLRLWNRIIRRK
jgi:hypothetical protein